jgi:hypothetical protein
MKSLTVSFKEEAVPVVKRVCQLFFSNTNKNRDEQKE